MFLDALIRWSVLNRLVVVAAAAAFLVWGSWVAVRMPVDVLPDMTAPTVTVLAEGHGMAPTDMEALVTFPLEAALNGASGVRRVRSSTAVGIAVVWVDFDWGADVRLARQTVGERLATVAATLPDGIDAPVMAPLSSIMARSCSSPCSRPRTPRWRCARRPRRWSAGGCWRRRASRR